MTTTTTKQQKRSAQVKFLVGQLRSGVQNYIKGLRECADNLRKVRETLSVESFSNWRIKNRAKCVASIRSGKLRCPEKATLRWRLGAAGLGKCAQYCQHHHALLQQSLLLALQKYETQIRKAIRNATNLMQRMQDAESAASEAEQTQMQIALAQVAALARKLFSTMNNAGREVQRVYAGVNVDALQYFLGRFDNKAPLQQDFDALIERGQVSPSAATLLKSACFGMRVAKVIGQLRVTASDLVKQLPDDRATQALLSETTRAADQLSQRMERADKTLCRRIAKSKGYDVCADRTCGPMSDTCKL